MNKWLSSCDALEEAMQHYNNGNLAQAVGLCTGLVERGECVACALLLRSLCFAGQERQDDAQYDHGRALALLGKLSGEDYFELGEECMDAGFPSSYCMALLTMAVDRLNKPGREQLLKASSLNKLGICCYRAGAQPSQEITYFNRGLDVLRDIDGSYADVEILDDGRRFDAGRLTALIQSNVAESYARTGDAEEAKRLYSLAAEHFEPLLNEEHFIAENYAACQRGLSELYRREADNVSASGCITKAISALERVAHDSLRLGVQLASSYNARGTLRFQMGDYGGEVEDCTVALKLRENNPMAQSEPLSTATVYFNRGEAYGELGNVEKEIEDFRSGLALLEGLTDPEERFNVCARRYMIGQLLSDGGQPEEAIKEYLQAADCCDKLRADPAAARFFTGEQLVEMEALCRFQAGVCVGECEQKEYMTGVSQYDRAIALLGELPLTPDRAERLATLHTSLGELYELFDEFDSAKESFLSAEHFRTVAVLGELADERATAEDSPDPFTDCISDDGAPCCEEVAEEDELWGDPSDELPQA